MQQIMLYICTVQRVTGGTWRVSLHEAVELCGDMSEQVLIQAVCWHSPDMHRTRNSHLRVTKKPRQAHKLCLRRICYTLWRAVESWFFCFQLSSCCFQLVKKLQAAQCRCLSGTPFECSSCMWCLYKYQIPDFCKILKTPKHIFKITYIHWLNTDVH